MNFAIMYSDTAIDFIVYLVLAFIAITISLVLHEVAHGLVAKWNGDYTAKYAGRLTLNPLKHFDPIGLVMMMLVGFGYAKPVPVNPYNFKHRIRGQILVSIAGVTVNLILAFVCSLFEELMLLALMNATTAAAINAAQYAMNFFGMMVTLNLCLFFFNLLPIFPLDGFRLIESLTHQGNKFCAFMRTNGQFLLYGLVGLSFVVSMAQRYVPALPFWFSYFDILGTYLGVCSGGVALGFEMLWSLIFLV